MELSITQQMIKGGHEVLVVRLGRQRLLNFPLNMRKLANSMVKEALSIDEKDSRDLIALVQKYGKLRDEHNDAAADDGNRTIARRPPPPVPPELPNAQPVVVALADHAVEFSMPLPAPAPTEMDTLAELLDCARQAEFQMDAAATDLERATNTFTEAERRADLAWRAFNEALHASLPVGTRIRGIQSDE